MKKNNIITVEIENDCLVQYSEKHIIDKKLMLTVPRGVLAIAYINGRAMYKSKQCFNENIVEKCGKEYIGQEIQFAFYMPGIHPEFSYGFGPINVNNERLKEAYRVGINGQMIIEIKDYVQLINYFIGNSNVLKIEDVKEKILPIIKSVGMSVVSSYFSDTNVSVFEINSKILEIREEMLGKLKEEKSLENIGITVESIAINEIFVNEDDLEMIRSRINN